jgi:predicted RNase H-like nuclease (RuvC/YqgF family)
MAEEDKWYRSPQGVLSAATIFTLVVGFFWVREKQMWENSARIAAVETRGDKAIISVNTRFERLEQVVGELKDRENFLERKIDRLEVKNEELEAKIKGWQQPYQ